MSGIDYVIDDDYIACDDYMNDQQRLSEDQQSLLVREFKKMITERAEDIQRDASYYGYHALSFDPKNLDIEGF